MEIRMLLGCEILAGLPWIVEEAIGDRMGDGRQRSEILPMKQEAVGKAAALDGTFDDRDSGRPIEGSGPGQWNGGH